MSDLIFNQTLPVAIGADHAGYEYKEMLKSMLEALGWTVSDKGTHSLDSVDYPDFAHPVAADVEQGKAAFGVLICGSGEGVCITANKHAGVRAALCWNNEVAQLSRQHNNANVICLPARFVSQDQAKEMLQSFIDTAFEGGRHANRVNKISC
ncbi:MAG: ribose 5-phosphate isomerase B [Chitinophagaceae bacterium]|jgi:ribose 5-phosphate isomerase B